MGWTVSTEHGSHRGVTERHPRRNERGIRKGPAWLDRACRWSSNREDGRGRVGTHREGLPAFSRDMVSGRGCTEFLGGDHVVRASHVGACPDCG